MPKPHTERGNNTTYGVVKAHMKKYGLEATRIKVYGLANASAEAVAMTHYIDTRQARESIREALEGYAE